MPTMIALDPVAFDNRKIAEDRSLKAVANVDNCFTPRRQRVRSETAGGIKETAADQLHLGGNMQML